MTTEMKAAQMKIKRDIESLQSQIKQNESSISNLKESLDTKLEVLTGELHVANSRIDQIENDITKRPLSYNHTCNHSYNHIIIFQNDYI